MVRIAPSDGVRGEVMSRLHPLVIHLPHDRLRVELNDGERISLIFYARSNAERSNKLYLHPSNGALLNQHYGMEIERSDELERMLKEKANVMSADQVRFLIRISEEGSLGREAARRIFNGEALCS